jgi:carbon storage regulator CsrA
MLVLTRKRGEWIRLSYPGGLEVRLVVTFIKGGVVRLGFEAPREVAITRPDMVRRGPTPPADREVRPYERH